MRWRTDAGDVFGYKLTFDPTPVAPATRMGPNDMIQNAFTDEPKPKAKPKPKTLAQQQNDFTAEGAPPAGNAAQTLPAVPAPAVDRAESPPSEGR